MLISPNPKQPREQKCSNAPKLYTTHEPEHITAISTRKNTTQQRKSFRALSKVTFWFH